MEIDTLKDYPIRVEEEGLNRYYGEIAYLKLVDKKVDKTQFIILLKKTRELQKETAKRGYSWWGSSGEIKVRTIFFR